MPSLNPDEKEKLQTRLIVDEELNVKEPAPPAPYNELVVSKHEQGQPYRSPNFPLIAAIVIIGILLSLAFGVMGLILSLSLGVVLKDLLMFERSEQKTKTARPKAKVIAIEPFLEWLSKPNTIAFTCGILFTLLIPSLFSASRFLNIAVLILTSLSTICFAAWSRALYNQLTALFKGKPEHSPTKFIASLHPMGAVGLIAILALLLYGLFSTQIPFVSQISGIWLLLLTFSTLVWVLCSAIAHLFWIFTFPFKLNNLWRRLGKQTEASTNLPNARETVLTIWFGTFGSTLSVFLALNNHGTLGVASLLITIAVQGLYFFKVKKLLEQTDSIYQDQFLLDPRPIGEIAINYQPVLEFERWRNNHKKKSNFGIEVVLLLLLCVFIWLQPQEYLFNFFRYVFTLLSTKAVASSDFGLNHWFNLLFGGGVLTLLSILGGYLLRLPIALTANSHGLRLRYRQMSGRAERLIKWSELKEIALEASPSSNNSKLSKTLNLKTATESFKLKLDNFKTPDEREKLLHQIEKYAPNIPRDAEVMELLAKPADHSYTEIWLTALSAPPKRERLKPLTPGATMNDGSYTVLNELGSGGQGFAYLARDKDGNEVVLKEFVLPIYVDIQARRRALERFENEARLLSRLDHPQVVKLNSFFIEDHRAYLVLEHIDGQNLRQLVAQNGPLSQEQVKELHTKMQSILDYLHSLSPPLVHRDFTPDNLILDKAGNLKLIDFNVAQEMQDGTTGTVVGKQSYLPPEQFRGQAEPASDLYAMGATLYYLLTGKDPTPISTIHIAQELPDIDASLDKLLTKLTALDPNNRTDATTGSDNQTNKST
jgi:tRNA A-37 threonylcarbamoyl transferase component Bud32/uncharacterized membrane protein YqhA